MQPFVEKKEENIRRSKSNFQLHFAAGWSLIYKRIFRSTDSGNWYFFIQVVLLHLRYFVWLHFLYFVAFCCVLLYLRHFVVLLYLRHCCILLYLRHFVALLYLWHCCILLYLRHDQLSRFESSQSFFCPVFCASTNIQRKNFVFEKYDFEIQRKYFCISEKYQRIHSIFSVSSRLR